MRIVYFLLNIREMKHAPLPELSEEIPGRNLYLGRNIKAVYDQVLEIAKARACLAIITHRGDSLSLMARVVADLGKFQPLLEHNTLKKNAIDDRIKDIHPLRRENRHTLRMAKGFAINPYIC